MILGILKYNDQTRTYLFWYLLATNTVHLLRKDEKVGFVDLWDCFVAKEDIIMRDDAHFN